MKKIFTLLAFIVTISTNTSAQNCARVLPGTTFVNPSGDNKTFDMIVNWESDGQKHIRISVRCMGTEIFNTCLSINEGGQSSGTTTYTGIVCPMGIDGIMATFTPFTGSCGAGTQCGGLQVLPPSGGPLPIFLDQFEGRRDGAVVALNWSTKMELNAKEFILQSGNGNTFNDVATIPAKNLESGSRYSYNDVNLTTVAMQYRLKMIDFDGTFKFSPVISIEGSSKQENVIVYPNPSRGNVRVQLNNESTIDQLDVFDISGRKVTSIKTGSNKNIQVTGLKSGMYLIHARDLKTGEVTTQRFSVIK